MHRYVLYLYMCTKYVWIVFKFCKWKLYIKKTVFSTNTVIVYVFTVFDRIFIYLNFSKICVQTDIQVLYL